MDALLVALGELVEPMRLAMLVTGVIAGLVIGVIPGIGGIFGITLLLPLTYTLDPYAAMALLLGMASVTTTADTIPAVLIGVPGTVGAAATAIDGHELAKKKQAARALGAAYSASLFGGVFGAVLLALSIPIIRPAMLYLNYGDFLAITVFGLTLVALLSGSNPIKGMLAALFGALVAFAGYDPFESTERWTFGQTYLLDGVPVGIVFLGLFGLSELSAIALRGQVQYKPEEPEPGGLRRGIGDTLRNWPLVLRSSALGAFLGAVPGVGVAVIEWVAYGDAARRPGKEGPFGQGNIRAVIAPEAANNSKEGGSLLPTVAFGIPGSAVMAILLGAFLIHGVTPGPDMLDPDKDLPLLIVMILTIALANIMGAFICLGLTRPLARLAMVPASTLVPVALVFVTLGAYATGRETGDLVFLLIFGAIGIGMKRLGWSRPAFALGFVLAPNLERFFFLAHQISGWEWITRPIVLLLLAAAAAIVLRRLAAWRKGRGTVGADMPARLPDLGLTLAFAGFAAWCLYETLSLPFAAAIFPQIVAGTTLGLAALLLWQSYLRRHSPAEVIGRALGADARFMAIAATLAALSVLTGHLTGPAIFLVASALWLGAPSLTRAAITVVIVTGFAWTVFDRLARYDWPDPWLLAWFAP